MEGCRKCFFVDPSIAQHHSEDVAPSALGEWDGMGGVVAFGIFGDACEDGAFGEGELAGGFVEVEPCGFFDTVAKTAKVDLVEIKVEDLFFFEVLFELSCEDGFADLAGVKLIGGEQKGFDDLLCNGGAALFGGSAFAPEIFPKSAQDAGVIESFVLKEVRIFGGDNGLDQVAWHLAVGDGCASLIGEFGNDLSVTIKDARNAPRSVVLDA